MSKKSVIPKVLSRNIYARTAQIFLRKCEGGPQMFVLPGAGRELKMNFKPVKFMAITCRTGLTDKGNSMMKVVSHSLFQVNNIHAQKTTINNS